MADDKPVLIYSTFPSIEAAESSGAGLLDAGLAACVNIIPGMISLYTWQGRRQRDQEVVMIVKTRVHLVDRATEEIRRSHPYDTPAIVALPVAGGSAAFLDWIMAETDDARASGGQG